MAGPLTWRQVAAPDFRGTMDGQRISAAALDRAFTGLSDGLGKFQEYRQGEAAGLVLNAAQGYADPAALRAAIADGSLFNGVNRSLVTPATLTAVNGQAGTLLAQATSQEALTQAGRMNPLLVDGQVTRNAAGVQDLNFNTAANPVRLEQMGATLEGTRQSTAASRQTMTQGATTFGQGQTDRADLQAGLAAGTEAIRTAASSTDAVASLESLNLSPNARRHAMALVETQFSGAYGEPGVPAGTARPQGGGSGGGARPTTQGTPTPAGGGTSLPASAAPGAGGHGTRAGSPYDVAYNFTPTARPITSMPISEVLDFQRTELRPRQGHSPVGAFQINHDTLRDMAPRVLGEGWQNQPLTPENQNRIAEALFNQRKRGNLSQTWAALPDRGVGGYANLTWEQVRPLIGRVEVGNDLSGSTTEQRGATAALSAAASTGVAGARDRVSQDNSRGIAGQFAAAAGSNDGMGAAVSSLTGRGGAAPASGSGGRSVASAGGASSTGFASVSDERIRASLTEIMQMDPTGSINPAMAAALLDRYGSADQPGLGMFGMNTPSIRLNREALQGEVNLIGQGGRANGGTATLEAAASRLEAAQSAHRVAEQELATIRERAQTVPGAAQHIARRQAILDRATEMLSAEVARFQRLGTSAAPRRSATTAAQAQEALRAAAARDAEANVDPNTGEPRLPRR